MTLSLEQISRKVYQAIRAKAGGLYDVGFYIEATFADYVVVCKGDKRFKVPYTVSPKGDVALGDETEVEVTYAAVTESLNGTVVGPEDGAVQEGEPDGSRWQVVVITEGLSENRNLYRGPVLEEAVARFEGVPTFKNHGKHPRDVADKIGKIVKPRYAVLESAGGQRKGAVVGTWVVSDAATRTHMLEAKSLGMLGDVHLSIDGVLEARIVEGRSGAYRDVARIPKINSVDWVGIASAGGHVLEGIGTEGEIHMFEQMLATLRKHKPEIVAGFGANPTEVQVREAYESLLTSAPGAPAAPAAPAGTTTAPVQEARGLSDDERLAVRESIVAKAFGDRKLPPSLRAKITKDLCDLAARPTLTIAAAESYIGEWVSALAPAADAAVGSGLGHTIEVGAAQPDTLKRRLDLLVAGTREAVEGVQPFRSFAEAYRQITGDTQMVGTRESMIGLGRFDRFRTLEGLISSDWGQILGDSVRRAMLGDFNTPDRYLDDWRKIVSAITSVPDFRTMRRMRMGGYADLSTVNERGTYQEFSSSPGDEEATYAVSKKGNIETITWEMTLNDDVGAIQRIPKALSRAAKRTLYKAVFDLLRTNATCTYDSTALAASGHGGNITTSALSQSTITTARRVMAEQTNYGDTDPLNLFPKTLIGPAELEELMWRLTKLGVVVTTNQNATEQAFQRHAGPNEYIVVPYWTDATDWWAVADPADIPTIEVGFLQGREEPRLLVADDPRSGAMFHADKIEMRVDLPFGVVILDHRGFYGGYGVA